MTRIPLYIEQDGKRRPLELGERLGRGGQATVHGVAGEPRLAAKLWLESGPAQQAKLAAQLRTVPEDPAKSTGHHALMWPEAAIVDPDGRSVGFVMPRLADRQVRAVHQLYHPGSRRENAPGIGWRYLVRITRNLSATVSALHAAGYVIGDLNESNVMATDRALVSMIDLDSIQVRDGRTVWRCEVGKLEYTPPELIGKSFREINRKPASDVFSFAVLAFQLLMEGFHPFSGVWRGEGDPPGLERNIRARRSPWFGSRQLKLSPAAPPVRILGPRLRRMFARSLLSPPFARPAARDWQRELDRFEAELKQCRLNPLHVYGGHLPACPWCARKLDLGADPFPPPA